MPSKFKKAIFSIALFCGVIFTQPQIVAAETNTIYLVCAGYFALAEKQDNVPWEQRSFTGPKLKVSGSFGINDKQIAVEGIPYMGGAPYDICENTDQALVFAVACDSGNPDLFNDSGILNKVTGIVHYHFGDILYSLKCRKTEKIIK